MLSDWVLASLMLPDFWVGFLCSYCPEISVMCSIMIRLAISTPDKELRDAGP